VPETFIDSLREWQTFFLLVGSAAAVLIGLLFVAISLGLDLAITAERADIQTFVTPSLTQFAIVLFIAVFGLFPVHRSVSLGLLLLIPGIVGAGDALANGLRLWRRSRRRHVDRDDWFWRGVLPLASVVALLIGGIGLLLGAGQALTVTAGATVALLGLGIHNAWALVVWMMEHRSDSPPS
jgi:hypothetical protein